jgi:hypothetical protein
VETSGGKRPSRSSSAAAVGTMAAGADGGRTGGAGESAFSTSTSVPPHASVPKISATETSKVTEVEPSTAARSSSSSSSRIQASSATAERCSISTPLGPPVEPEVKMT